MRAKRACGHHLGVKRHITMFLHEIKPGSLGCIAEHKNYGRQGNRYTSKVADHNVGATFFFGNAINLLGSEVDKNQMLGQEIL